MSTLVKTDPFAEALATMAKELPDEMKFEVAAREFRNVGSLDRANGISSTMEDFKLQAAFNGYSVKITYLGDVDIWEYRLTKGKGNHKAKVL